MKATVLAMRAFSSASVCSLSSCTGIRDAGEPRHGALGGVAGDLDLRLHAAACRGTADRWSAPTGRASWRRHGPAALSRIFDRLPSDVDEARNARLVHGNLHGESSDESRGTGNVHSNGWRSGIAAGRRGTRARGVRCSPGIVNREWPRLQDEDKRGRLTHSAADRSVPRGDVECKRAFQLTLGRDGRRRNEWPRTSVRLADLGA